MASSVNFYVISVILCMLMFFHGYANGTVPAMYVFGDSLADVGNNDYLPLSVLKANFLPNGIDYNGGQATGRFSNGKNSADLLAEKLGLATSPPYLNITSDTNKTEAFISGVSFASGGAGVLDSTNKGQCLTFPNQVDSFSTVHQTLVDALGSDAAMSHLSKSIFCFIIGSNDILDYTRELIKPTPQDFVNSLVSNLQVQLQRLHSLGARKLVFVGTGPIGCCPSQRTQNSTNCNEQANQLSALYNKGASNLLHKMKSNHTDFNYSFLDASSALLQYLKILQNTDLMWLRPHAVDMEI
ncbi:GDSL esterase/lipase At5g55050-like [Dioscorea cayenensis subsp. rotundata]|uniref:GDSL esterase/lipase At5g55050-like n=1 Tax=Dioscorea cayennensis subsp. rotundata TaxID=55577 RepID=A0AB40CME8_DIOCR|nr:GDSL esterase/lipase At5g55050-like [Dioscorea cayenensis subsp. rotundata]